MIREIKAFDKQLHSGQAVWEEKGKRKVRKQGKGKVRMMGQRQIQDHPWTIFKKKGRKTNQGKQIEK